MFVSAAQYNNIAMASLSLPCSSALAAVPTSSAPAPVFSSSRLPPCRPALFPLGRKLRGPRPELRCSPSSTVSDVDSSSRLGSSPAGPSGVSRRTKSSTDAEEFVSRYAADEPRKGCDVLVEALERAGVDTVFAYPGGASMEIHQALTRTDRIRNILCRHEQGIAFSVSRARLEPVVQFVVNTTSFLLLYACLHWSE